MSLATTIQNKIETKIFERLGSTVTRKPYDSQSTNKWGDATTSFETEESIIAVPYNYLKVAKSIEPFGDLKEGEVMMAFKYGQELNEKDIITHSSQDFIITQIEELSLSDEIVLKIGRLEKQH